MCALFLCNTVRYGLILFYMSGINVCLISLQYCKVWVVILILSLYEEKKSIYRLRLNQMVLRVYYMEEI